MALSKTAVRASSRAAERANARSADDDGDPLCGSTAAGRGPAFGCVDLLTVHFRWVHFLSIHQATSARASAGTRNTAFNAQ